MLGGTENRLRNLESSEGAKAANVVSVIIPAYNRGTSIQEAIRSVLSQTYQRFEIVVVDDGSQDCTESVLQSLTRADSRIRYLRHPFNRGAQAARNTGIRAAKGQWIAFLDSDDQWLPDSLELRFRAASYTRREVIHSDCLVITSGAETQRFGIPPTAGQVYRKLLHKPAPMFPSLFVSKEALARIGDLDETVVAYQEWDTAIRLAKFYQFEFLTEPTFIYDCRHSDSISKDSLRSAIGYEQVFMKHRWDVLRYLGPNALVRHYRTAAEMYGCAGDEQNAQRCLRQAFLWWPFQPRTILRGIQRFVRPKE